MEQSKKAVLPKNFSIDNKYSVLLFIKHGVNAETYRVKGSDGKLFLLKLFNYSKLHRSAFDKENNVLEIELIKTLQHPNIVAFEDSGELIFEGRKYGYLVLEFIAGETLAERITRNSFDSLYDIKLLLEGVLSGLNYLHHLTDPVIHNEIIPQNIMLDLSGDIPVAKIIDFGYARSFYQSSKSFNREGLNLNYLASECFNNLYSPQSDLFSVGAVIYQMLYGMPPWFKDISKFKMDRTKAEDVVLEARKKKLTFPETSTEIVDFDESVVKIIEKALQQDPEDRFQSADEFMKAVNGEIEVEDIDRVQKVKLGGEEAGRIETQKAKGKGYQ